MAYNRMGAIEFAQCSGAMSRRRVVKWDGSSLGRVRYDGGGGRVGLERRRENEGQRVTAGLPRSRPGWRFGCPEGRGTCSSSRRSSSSSSSIGVSSRARHAPGLLLGLVADRGHFIYAWIREGGSQINIRYGISWK